MIYIVIAPYITVTAEVIKLVMATLYISETTFQPHLFGDVNVNNAFNIRTFVLQVLVK